MTTENDNPNGSSSRREFIGSSALTAAGVGLGVSAYLTNKKTKVSAHQAGQAADHKKPEKLLKMGFIGVGNRGGSLLRTALQVPGAIPIAIADVQPTHRNGRAKDTKKQMVTKLGDDKFQVATYDDYRRLLDNKDVEAVVIATPHYLHGPMAVDAIEAGKHVYCEKALAFTIGENQDIYRLVESGKKAGRNGDQDLVFQVGHQRHYSPLYRKVKEMVHGDRIGDVAAIRAQWNLNSEIRRPTADPELEKVVNWRLYSELSGGLTTEFATHQIDVANWIFSPEEDGVVHPDSVAGYGGVDWYTDDGRDTQDNIHLIFNYKIPVYERNAYGRYKLDANGKRIAERDDKGQVRKRNARFMYMSIMENSHLGPSELVMGRYGTIGLSLAGGEFWKEKKSRQDPDRIAEGTNPARAHQKSILKSGPTVATSFGGEKGDHIEERILSPDGSENREHWSNYIEPIKGAYDKIETLLAMESFVDCCMTSRAGKPFAHKLSANCKVGVYSAVPALMANIAMREQRTVYWSEFYGNGA